MKPFSDNVIFFDTEFSNLDPYKGEVLSIGMVKVNGDELYLEIENTGEVSPWVRENVLPLLTQPRMTREEARQKIIEFAGENKPYLVSYVIEFDAPFLYKLLGVDDENGNRKLPYHWIILDFASMLFALGRNPSDFAAQEKDALIKELGIDISMYREHHALDDAKVLREVYLKLISH